MWVTAACPYWFQVTVMGGGVKQLQVLVDPEKLLAFGLTLVIGRKTLLERLMGAPCEDASETLCRYVSRGVEFKLEDGDLAEQIASVVA